MGGEEEDEFARTPPSDVARERLLLSAMMNAPADAIQDAIQAGLAERDFYRPAHEVIAHALICMWAAEAPVDPATVADWITRDGDLRALGGHGEARMYLFGLWEMRELGAVAGHHAAKVHKLAVKRREVELGQRMIQRGYSLDPDTADTDIAQAEAELAALAGVLAEPDYPLTPERFVAQAAERAGRRPGEKRRPRWVIPGMMSARDRAILVGPEGAGKALALDTPVPTPKGWTTMGALSPGDQVFGPDGKPARVVAVTPPMRGRPCYRLRFSDGAEIVADAAHQWVTETARGREERRPPVVTTTEGIAATLRARGGHQLNHAIAACAPLEYPAQDLPVPPYTLGAWLGDGTSRLAEITCDDLEILSFIRQDGYAVTPVPSKPSAWSIRVPQGPRTCLRCRRSEPVARSLCHSCYETERLGGKLSRWPLMGRPKSLTEELRLLGVLGGKHIPAAYLHAAPGQRLALLQGLMDTDGWVSGNGRRPGRGYGSSPCEFCVTSERLARDVLELLLGLGVKVTFRESPAVLYGRRVGTRYRLHFNTGLPVFRLPRKAARLTAPRTRRGSLRYITACDPAPSVPVACLQVDREDGMFVAGRECIPTHNSMVGLQMVLAGAVGLHPFTFEPIPPVRGVYIDLETPEDQLAGRVERMLEVARRAGRSPEGRLAVWSRDGEWMRLSGARDQHRLSGVFRRHFAGEGGEPRMVVAGPLYKLLSGKLDEDQHIAVAAFWNRVISRWDCALWLEAHAPMAQAGKRDWRPMASGVWTRWPEVGRYMRPVKNEHRTWQLPGFRDHDRDDLAAPRCWPDTIWWRAGPGWPWGGTYDPSAFQDKLFTPAAAAEQHRDAAEERADDLAARRAQARGGQRL